MPDTKLPQPEQPTTAQPVVAIPAPITRSIDQLLQTIASHQHQTSVEAQIKAASADSAAAEPSENPARHTPQHLSALLDIVNRLHDDRGQETASRRLVNDLASHLAAVTHCEVNVSLAMVHETTQRCKIEAASDALAVDPNCEHIVARQSAAQECVARDVVSVWPANSQQTRHALLAHQQLATTDSANSIVTVPLKSSDEQSVAIAVCSITVPEGGIVKEATDEVVRFLTFSAAPLATAIQIRHQLDRPWWKRLGRKVRAICSSGRYQIAALCIALGTAAMFIPMDYKVSCHMELQPVSRRFVASPFAAQLQTCFVESGDVVEEGQVLAKLDGREIQWELSGVLADLEKARKERNTHLSERSYGLAAIARHETQRLQNQASLLQDRLKKLEIKSPIAGIIVAGDLKDTEGAPLETGQSLFEVAPLDRMKVRVGIPEDDVRHVEANMETLLLLDAMPSEELTTSLVKLNPKAEIFEDDNVFFAEAELMNDAQLLRPGMRGRAWVSTGPQPLGWNLFHKPVAWAAGWLGW